MSITNLGALTNCGGTSPEAQAGTVRYSPHTAFLAISTVR